MSEIDSFKEHITNAVETVNRKTYEIRKNSELRVARRYCCNNFISLVDDCYNFMELLSTKEELNEFKLKCTIILDFSETRILFPKQKIN